MDALPLYNSSHGGADKEIGFSPTSLIFAASFTFIIMIVGICGNFLTIIALLRCPKVRNVAAAFIISLCLADLIFCALVLPFSALRFIEGTWTHGDFLCKMIPFIQYGNIGVSLLCIAMITINRYVMIAHHSTYARIYKRHWIAVMIAFCWLLSYGMQLPTLLGIWGVFDYDPKLGTCSIMNDAKGHSSKTPLFITAFVIPCLVIIACYTKIFWVVHKSEQRLKRHALKHNSIPNNQRHLDGNGHSFTTTDDIKVQPTPTTKQMPRIQEKHQHQQQQRDLKAKRNEWRITKMVLAIFLSFLICYLPITVAKVADKNVHLPSFHILSYMMLYLSACINPIIYVIMNKQYRKAYRTVIGCELLKSVPLRILRGGGGGGGGGAGGGGDGRHHNQRRTGGGGDDDDDIDGVVVRTGEEKWKDIELSQNPSRTIVSQISLTDAPSTSFSTSPSSQPINFFEMTMTKMRMGSAINPFSPSTMDKITMPTMLSTAYRDTALNQQQQHHNNGTVFTPKVTATPSPTSPTSPPSSTTPSTMGNNHEAIRITLSGGDIILEEEEDESPSMMRTATATTTTTLEEIGNQKKIPSYGQNMNAIPDNNVKLTEKQKL